MRAIITNNEVIQKWSTKSGVEVGDYPKGIPLKFLRFDGEKVVNILELNQFWVDSKLQLHVSKIDNSCQLVSMTYSQRKDLINDKGTIRLKGQDDKDNERMVIDKNRFDRVYKKRIQQEIGSDVDEDIINEKIFYLLVKLILTKDDKLKLFFEKYLEKYEDIVDIEYEKTSLIELLEKKAKILID